MLIDTHTHLYLDEFQPSPSEAVVRAINAGVEKMIFPNVDLSTIEPMKALQKEFPQNAFMAMGLHPTEVSESWENDLDKVYKELIANKEKYIAIGEIGIDLYWDKTYRKEQLLVLRKQFDWAVEFDLPVIIHCREGLNEILEVLDAMENKPRGVFHSFVGTIEDVEQIRSRGDYYFGINGIVTFKNSKLREVLSTIGLDRILLETDAPYLAPVPHRGKRNESAYIVHTAAHIAQSLSLSMHHVETITTENAQKLFGI